MLTFFSEQCIYALFTDPQISFFINFFIKNGSHSTIYTFKNYFATVISAISFQFQQNKSYPNRPPVYYHVGGKLRFPTRVDTARLKQTNQKKKKTLTKTQPPLNWSPPVTHNQPSSSSGGDGGEATMLFFTTTIIIIINWTTSPSFFYFLFGRIRVFD